MLSDGQAVTKKFKDMDLIFREGSEADEMYVIWSGKVKITKNMYGIMVKLDTLGPDAVFGEMALVDDSPRSASAIAVGDVEVGVYDRPAFLEAIKTDPELALRVMRQLARRLRAIDTQLTDMVAKGRLPKEEAAELGKSGYW